MPEPREDRRAGRVKALPFTGSIRVIGFGIAGAAIGLAACLALSLVFGGWGPPPVPLFLVGVGLVLGVVASFAKPAKRPPA